MSHTVTKEDLEDYLKCLAVKRGCPVDSVDRSKAHWNLIMNRKLAWKRSELTKETSYIAALRVVSGLLTSVTETVTVEK